MTFDKFEEFTKGTTLLQIWSGGKVIFESNKRGVAGLLEFIDQCGKKFNDLVIFDSKVGNAAALLFVFLSVKEVFGVVGSELAKETLEKFKIKFYFQKTIPNILNKDGTDLCPLEKLSLFKSPEDFFETLTNR